MNPNFPRKVEISTSVATLPLVQPSSALFVHNFLPTTFSVIQSESLIIGQGRGIELIQLAAIVVIYITQFKLICF